MYHVNEIFYSLQGEGHWTGKPMVFVRFCVCNLKCPFCDTDFADSKTMSCEEIVKEAESIGNGCRTVVFTGGEPALQIDKELIEAFHKQSYRIHIETNGTRKLPEGIDWVTVSPKSDWQENAEPVLESANELKLVYTGQTLDKWEKFNADHFYLQPCSCSNTKEVVTYVMSHPLWNLSIQTHKLLDIK